MKYPFKKTSYKIRKWVSDVRKSFLKESDLINELKSQAQSKLPIDVSELMQATKTQLKLDKLKQKDASIDILERMAVILVSTNAKENNYKDGLQWAIEGWKNKEAENKFFTMWQQVYSHPDHQSLAKDNYLCIMAYKNNLRYLEQEVKDEVQGN